MPKRKDSLVGLSVEEQLHIIASGAEKIVPLDGLKKKLEQGRPLTVKLGVDPTSPDLHLGHAVPLQKMRQFQDLGHNVTLIIGNGTALIGDPSGKNSTRPQLTSAQIEANAQTYVEQAMKVLDPERTTVVHNGDWILSMNLERLLEIASKFTVARILERDDFTKRYNSHAPIALHEFLYPVMQAYDSVMIKADVEMGGSDQLFNLLAGRELMEKMGMEPQVALCMPLLEGTDGVRKMSKSYGNYVGLTDAPDDMFGKVMSIPDTLIVRYYRLATKVPVAQIDQIEADLAAGTGDPNALKRALARTIIDNYHGAGAGELAEEAFNRVHRNREVPEDVADLAFDLSGEVYVPALLQAAGFAQSAGEGRRLIDGGGLRVDGAVVAPKTYNLPGSELDGKVVQAGKRRFVRVVALG
jgi:tyrosyl-tRNA synthetase